MLVGQRAHHPLDYVQLVDLRVTGKYGLSVADLSHDAADGPHVHPEGVVGGAQQQLRCCLFDDEIESLHGIDR